ncbi:MAG: carbohydrate porin [Pseudomonadota bacterium]
MNHVEIGWTPSFENRRNSKVQLTYWEKDERPEAGVSSGDGWLLTAHHKFDNGVLPFIRIGHSDGGAGVPAEEAVTLGLGYDRPRHDLFSVALGWAEPSEETFGPDLDDEFVLETSWKFQMSPNASILPNIQYIRNPASNPGEDSTWVASLRVRWDI